MLSFKQFLLERYSRDFKGWMSSKGTPDDYEMSEHHGLIWHPEAKQESAPITCDNFPKFRIDSQLSQGFTRYSKYRDHNYIHYDKNSTGGKKSALHALNHLNLRHGDTVSIYSSKDGLQGNTLKLREARKHILEN